MIQRLAYIFLILAFPAQAGINANQVAPNLAILSQGFGFRILVYSVCSPEHCWSETYLQNVSLGTEEPKILCSKKIDEIAYGHVISQVVWGLKERSPEASLLAKDSHGGFEPRTVTIKPEKDCEYKIHGASTAGN